jgi:hypothetical protein
MDKRPDSIIPAAQREGLTERPPARPVLPDPDAAPRARLPLATSTWRHYLAVIFIAACHFFLTLLALILAWPLDSWVETCLAVVWFFPVLLLELAGGGPANHPLAAAFNSLVWAASVYGLFLTSHWTYRGLLWPDRTAFVPTSAAPSPGGVPHR